MNRARLIHLSSRLINSVSSTQHSKPNSLIWTQVTHFSLFIQSTPTSLSKKPPHFNYFPITHQYLFYSSTPESFIKLVSSNNWSQELVNELEKSNPKLTHESIVYILMNSSKDPLKALDFFKWVCDRNEFQPSSMLYNLLLRILAGSKFMEQFWAIALEMKEKEFYIGQQTYLTVLGALKKENLDEDVKGWTELYHKMNQGNARIRVVKDVVEVIMGSDWSVEVENKLNKVKCELSDEFLVMVIKELWSHPLKALKYFDWVSHSRGYEHNAVSYNEMAKVLAQPESMGEFWGLVKLMRSEGYEMDIDTYLKISRRLGHKDAVELFEFMMDGPYKPSVQNCALLLKNLSLKVNPDMDLVHRVVNKFEGAGNTLTKSIYDGIHRALCKVGRFDEAHKIVEAIKNAGCKPDNVTYSQEIHGLCQLKRFEEALKVFEHMEAEECIPDLKTWTILIKGYCIAGEMDQALLCLGKMMDKSVDPDANLLKVFVNGFLYQKKVLGAYTFLIEMVKNAHLKPWQATYKLMIDKLLEIGKLEEAYNLLSMMKQHDYPSYPTPFVQYISKSGSVEDAKQFLNVLPVKGSPSTSAYVHVITAFFNEGRHAEAKDLLYKSPRAVRVRKDIGNLFGSANSNV